jgi:hypothetical protein
VPPPRSVRISDDPDFKKPYERLMMHARRICRDDEHDFQGGENFTDDRGRIMGASQV